MSIQVEEKEIVEALVQSGAITNDQLNKAVEFRNSLGAGKLRDLVVKLGYASEADIFRALSTHEIRTPIKVTQLDRKAMKAIPNKTLEAHKVVVLKNKMPDKRITLAMIDTNDLAVIEEIQFLTNKVVDPVLGTKETVEHALEAYLNNHAKPMPTPVPPVKKIEVIPVADIEDDDIDIDDIDIDDLDESELPDGDLDYDEDQDGALQSLAKLPDGVLTRAFILAMIKNGAVSANQVMECVKMIKKD